jgi:hypothetical protein
MPSVTNKTIMLSIVYAECSLCLVLFMLCRYAQRHYAEFHYAECLLCRVSFMPSVIILSVVMLNVFYADYCLC